MIAIITVTFLVSLGMIHFYWAFGGKAGLDRALPTKDGRRLINPGRFLTFLVGIFLSAFAFVAYLLRFDGGVSDGTVYAGWALSALFFLRAVGDFNAVGFFKKIKSSDFAAYDTKYYSPFCVYFGLAFALLSYRAQQMIGG